MREAGVEEMVDGVLATFQEEAPGRMADLEAAMATKNATAISLAAHAFKSAAGSIHAKVLTKALTEAEAAGRSQDVAAAVAMLERVRRAHSSTATYLASHARETAR
jgi:HPt (histidine-containing phosphotransfer) domain-containing protein